MISRAYAKINLTLAVARPEPAGSERAGWHRIASWFHAVDLWDDVELLPSPDGHTRCEVAFDPESAHVRGLKVDWPLEKDLGLRALRALESAVGKPLASLLRVRKRIPAGGGLGGGSSNAASVLKTANQLFQLGLSQSQLVTVGRSLGSDVEFFLDQQTLMAPPRAAFVEGFGDQIERIRSFTDPISLLLTGIPCPTAEVYRAFNLSGISNFNPSHARAAFEVSCDEGRVVDEMLFNQLTMPACLVQPALGSILEQCARAMGSVHLSGSGGTAFVLGHANASIPSVRLIATRLV